MKSGKKGRSYGAPKPFRPGGAVNCDVLGSVGKYTLEALMVTIGLMEYETYQQLNADEYLLVATH